MSRQAYKKKLRSEFWGGLESSLDLSGFFAVLLGLLLAVRTMVVAGFGGVVPAIVQLAAACIIRLVLRTLAELLRLHKKRMNLPYSGKISEAAENVVYICSECGGTPFSDSQCASCGRTFEVRSSE